MSLLDSLLGGYVFAQQNGAPSAVPSRRTLIFAGATVIDDGPTANSTTILISGGGGSFPGGDLCSGTGTSVSVGSGLVLASGTLSAPSPFVHASTQLLDGTGSAVTVGSGLSLAAGTITAAGGGGGASVGTFAARPASGTTGQVYVPTDEGGAAIYDGSAWRPMIGQYIAQGLTLASFTQLNLSPATVTQTGDSVSINLSGVAAGNFVRGLTKSGSSYVVTSGRVLGIYGSNPIVQVGAFMRESSTQKSTSIGILCNWGLNSATVSASHYSSDTSRDALQEVNFGSVATFTVPFFRIDVVGGTTAKCSFGFSPNGPWATFYTFAGAWSVAPDQVGFYANTFQGTGLVLAEHFDGA